MSHFKSYNNVIFPAVITTVLLIAITGCGTSLSKDNRIFQCNGDGANRETEFTNLQRPHFITRQLTGSRAEAASVLYRLNTNTLKAEPVVIRGSESTDSWALRDTRLGQILMLERFQSKSSSRLTRVACETNLGKNELGSLPENTFGIGYLADNLLIALGWNRPELTAFRSDFSLATSNTTQPISQIPVVNTALGLTESDTHMNNLLVKNGQPFVVSSGLHLSTFTPAQTKLLQLDGLASIVVRAFDVPSCRNAYQDYTLQISASEVLLGCNPQYAGATPGQETKMVYVKINDNTAPEFNLLDANPLNDAQIIEPGGSTADGNWIFVTEKITQAQNIDASPGKHLRSYWINKNSNQKISMDKLSGDVIYDRVEKSYVFSCIISPATGECSPGVFAVLSEENWNNPSAARLAPIQFDYDFFHFERPIF